MNKILLTGFVFKPVELKKHKPNHNSKNCHKLYYCVCVEKEPNVFVAHLNLKNDLEFPDILEIPFTAQSYDLKGKTRIFTKQKDKNGKSTYIIRNISDATHFPGLPTQYTPFRHKYVYSGHIVKSEKGHEFDVIDIIDYMSLCTHLISDISL